MTSFYDKPWQKPYLTPSLAKVMLDKTPYHAWLACPYYNEPQPQSSDAMNEGRVVDCLVLGGDPGVTVIDVDGYRTKEARALRDAAVNPMKITDYERCLESAEAVQFDILSADGIAARGLSIGTTKQRIFWPSAGVDCSTEPDIAVDDCILDLKRTKVAPTAANWQRHASSMGYHIQAAACLEGTGATKFGWIVVEADPPHCVVVHWASDLFIKVGQRDWSYAKQIWANCVATGHFPAYESGEIDPTGWLVGEDGDEITFTEDAE